MKYLIPLLLFPCLAFSQTITEVNGAITQDGYIYITGSEFGKNPLIEAPDRPQNDGAENEPRAGILLGNNADYLKCTKIDRMVVSAWWPSSITTQLNFSSFSPGEKAYVFVVTTNGLTSKGHLVTVTKNEGPGRPGTPTNTRFVKY